MEAYIICFCKDESDHYPQSLREVRERISNYESMLVNYQKAIGTSYYRIEIKETDKDLIESLKHDVEGYVLEIAILFGRLKFITRYLSEQSFERFRRITSKVLEMDLKMNSMISKLLEQSKGLSEAKLLGQSRNKTKKYEIEIGIEKIMNEVIDEFSQASV